MANGRSALEVMALNGEHSAQIFEAEQGPVGSQVIDENSISAQQVAISAASQRIMHMLSRFYKRLDSFLWIVDDFVRGKYYGRIGKRVVEHYNLISELGHLADAQQRLRKYDYTLSNGKVFKLYNPMARERELVGVYSRNNGWGYTASILHGHELAAVLLQDAHFIVGYVPTLDAKSKP